MCDVCSTSVFNYHFTCGTCGFLVCLDCFNGRMRGTRYKTLGTMAKPYRTHKSRDNKNLDKNLWPLCLERKSHQLEELLLTHMSPGRIPMEIVEEIHSLRKILGMPSNCNCCKKAEVYDVTDISDSSEKDNADIVHLMVCIFCEISFAEVDDTCKLLHLAGHLEDQLMPGTGTKCPTCSQETGSRDLLLAHITLVHGAVQHYLQHTFRKAEVARQSAISLQVDLTPACEICGCKFTVGAEEKRKHYLGHMEETLMNSISVCEPFKCTDCGHIEISRRSLMTHVAIVHKQLDGCIDLTKDNKDTSKTFRSWIELKNCVVCNEVMPPTTGESSKRLHYLGHFQTELEARVNSETQKLLKKPPPYSCLEPNCKYTTELTVKTFLCHMVTKHKKLDTIIDAAAENHFDKCAAPPDQFYVTCAVCGDNFDDVSGKENIALGKGHYASHYKTQIDTEFRESFKEETVPIHCPFRSCDFSTKRVLSDQYGHHKKKILVHIGHDHKVFRKLALNKSIKGLGLQKNRPAKIARHTEESGLFLSRCILCSKVVRAPGHGKSEKMLREEMKKHLESHVGHMKTGGTSFQEAMQTLLACPESGTNLNYRHFFIPANTESYVHKPSDPAMETAEETDTKSDEKTDSNSPARVINRMKSVNEEPGFEKIKLSNLVLIHETERKWHCEFCQTTFDHPTLGPHEWRKHILEHFKEGVSFKIGAMNLTCCDQCDLKTKDENSLIYHLAFVHSDIDVDIKRAASKWDKEKLEAIQNKIDHCLTRKAQNKRKNTEKLNTSASKISRLASLDMTECIEEVEPSELEDESVLRTLFGQKPSIIKAGKTATEKEWELIGSRSCELCEETFTTPGDKREHLALKHFTSLIIQDLRTISINPACPHCDYKQSSPIDLLKHVVREHKMVDKHHAVRVPHLQKAQKIASGEAVQCVLCPEAVDLKEKASHLLEHFITGCLVPLISQQECTFPGCIMLFPVTSSTQPHGLLAKHLGNRHPHLMMAKVLGPKVSNWLGADGEDVVKQVMVGLLTGEVCLICQAWVEGPLNTHYHLHLQPLKIRPEQVLPTLTSASALLALKKSLNLQASHSPQPRPISDPSPSSSLSPSPSSSRCSSPCGWTQTAGGRPPPGIWPEGRTLCEFSGCEGYLEPEYYAHMTRHFRDLLRSDINKEKTAGSTPLACPRCIYAGQTEEELLVHYGSYHKLIDFYVSVARDFSIVDQLETPTSSKVSQSGRCGQCAYTSGRGVAEHRKAHVRHLLAGLPSRQPYICPVCWYEAGSRMGLVRHWGQVHGEREVGNQREEGEGRREEADPELSMIHASATYGSQKVWAAPKRSPILVTSPKDRSFSNMIHSLLGPDSDDTDEEEADKMEHSLPAQLARWFSEVSGLTPGLDNQIPDQSSQKEPGLGTLAPRHVCTHQESLELAPDTAHSWLCEGRLLQLHDAISPGNMALFQQQWDRGQPVLIGNSNERMNHRLWHPRAFAKDFGHLRSDLVNTLTGKTVPRQPLKWFWEGFENVSLRLLDAHGTPMLLKLKDWPPDGDIAEYMPKRFHDLVHDFPIQAYTLREGNINLASYIPDYFLRPELGPKMYIAYGNALYSDKASTNLHLDMSDACNLMVYVGIPGDSEKQENIRLVLSQIDEAGCDLIMRRRVRDEGELPGAIWHIYHPGDTNKIRDLLNRVAIEKGRRLDPHDDPIHDQSTYLDAKLRMRLYSEYGVKGYTIIQCAGDTVFIPCGACHQVRNLHNCIKIAEDFVSPELANNCLHLTQVCFGDSPPVLSLICRNSAISQSTIQTTRTNYKSRTSSSTA